MHQTPALYQLRLRTLLIAVLALNLPLSPGSPWIGKGEVPETAKGSRHTIYEYFAGRPL